MQAMTIDKTELLGGLGGLASALLAAARLLFLLPMVAPAAENFLDNGVIKLGVDLTRGGSITWLSASGSTNNIVNSHDLGREIQPCYYSGPQPYNPSNTINPDWKNWPWNPIQSGDYYGHASVVLAQANDGKTLYVKCRPMQWALDHVPGQCILESWITLSNNVVVVSNRLVNLRRDTAQQFHAMDQELPAAYTVGTLWQLVSYAGNAPFTGDAVTHFPVTPPPWRYWNATESWAALVNSNNWGLGVYHPGWHGLRADFSANQEVAAPRTTPPDILRPSGMRFWIPTSFIRTPITSSSARFRKSVTGFTRNPTGRVAISFSIPIVVTGHTKQPLTPAGPSQIFFP